MEDKSNWFGMDASYIRPDVFPDGEYIIMFHPRYKNKPVKWFTPERVAKMITKAHAEVIKTTIEDVTTENTDTRGSN